MNNRVGVFVFFDIQGIVDEYVLYLLDAVKETLDTLIIVSNGSLSEINRNKLENYSDYYIERDNSGFDFGAWKEVIVNKFPRDFWNDYEEIVFLNDTFYGPIKSLQEVFDTMGKRDADIWGMTRFGHTMEGDELYPPFLQTYFWVVRKSLFSRDAFFDFWNMVDEHASDFSIVQGYEKQMSKYFIELGYKIDTYIDTTDFEAAVSDVKSRKAFNISLDKMALYELLKRGFPFLKRKNFFYPSERVTEYTFGDDLSKALSYVNANTQYDLNLVFQNVMRLRKQEEIAKSLCLNYVLNTEGSGGNTNLNSTLLIVYIDEYVKKDFVERLKAIGEIELFFVFDSIKTKKKVMKRLNRKTILSKVASSENLYKIIISSKELLSKYTYIGFVRNLEYMKMPFLMELSYQEMLLETMVKSNVYIRRVIELFESDPFLGMLYPNSKISPFNKYSEAVLKNYGNNKDMYKTFRANGFWVRSSMLMGFIDTRGKKAYKLSKHSNSQTAMLAMLDELEVFAKTIPCYIGTITTVKYAELCINNFL